MKGPGIKRGYFKKGNTYLSSRGMITHWVDWTSMLTLNPGIVGLRQHLLQESSITLLPILMTLRSVAKACGPCSSVNLG